MSGHIERRGKESWRVVVELGRDPATGRRRTRKLTVRGRKRDAERALTEALRLRDQGIDIAPSRITVAEYLERWTTDYAEASVAPSTLARYRHICRRLGELVGGVRLQALRPAHIQAAYSQLRARGLAPRTILHHHRVLKEALRHAVGWQLLERNPADAVTAPRAERVEMRSLDADEVGRLLDGCRDDDMRRLVFTAVSTGLRLGELLGLRWSDVDLKARAATIRRTAQYLGQEGVQLRSPKTSRSRRTVSLSPATVSVLREHRAAQNERRLLMGPAYVDEDAVFCAPDGRLVPPYSISGRFRRLVRRIGLGSLRFHDLRHTSATLALQAGIPAQVVSRRLGHASVAFTLDTYAHVLPDQQREAADLMDTVLPAPSRAR